MRRLERLALCAVFASCCAGAAGSRSVTDFAARDSSSVGSPLDGRLVNGVALPSSGPGFRLDPRRADRRHGTAELVRALVRAAEAVHRALPGGELTIQDLGARGGGELPGHASHRSGRDADVSFFLLDGSGRPRPGLSIPIDPDGRGTDYHSLEDPGDDEPVALDVPRTWKFVEALLLDEEAHVQRIFVVEHVRALLLEHARKVRAPRLAVKLFAAVTCQPAFPHDDHMHVRVFCSAGDVKSGCEDLPPVYPWHLEHLRAVGVAPRLARPGAGRRAEVTSHAEARARAGPMHPSVVEFLERRAAWIRQPHPGREYCP